MSFITALLLAYEPAKRLARLHVQLTNSLAGVRLMTSLLDAPASAIEMARLPDLDVRRGAVEFRDVSFGYRDDQCVLANVSFRAEPNSMLALVGLTGSGKSTSFALLQRFYDVRTGAILIDGQDVREVSAASLRQAIAYVSQDTYLFAGSVRENIRLGRRDARDDEVEEAARLANADEFVCKLPHGYDSLVGENGAQLSGGQRQRIAIARAFLRNAPIILFDEATSALDSETEHVVQLAMARLAERRTSVIIAHRLASVRNADLVLVLQDGHVVQKGTHFELLKQDGLYRRLWRLQSRELRDESADRETA